MPHQDIPSCRTMSVLDLGTRLRLAQVDLLDTQIRLQQSEDRHHREDATSRFVCKTWEPEHNAYTELAHTTRAARSVLPADQLLPHDSILLDGELLIVADVRVTERMVILAFEDLDWGRSVSRRRLVRLA